MNVQTLFDQFRAKASRLAVGLCVAMPAMTSPVAAQDSDVLAECMALSSLNDDIHACLDNYLDVMDANLTDISSYIRREFGGESRAAFDRSQAAFESFRRENCLWYLEISAPRSAAEQIAKNCLARHSIDRLSELQGLLARDDAASQVVDGFYVFGANRNSFRPCGSDGRYLVVGDALAVGDLQRRYSGLASVDLQILFASVTGEIDSSIDGGADHNGVINISSIRDLRFPSDSDCNLPTGSPQVAAVSASDAPDVTSVEERVADIDPVVEEVSEPVAVLEPLRNPVADLDPVQVPGNTAAESVLPKPATPSTSSSDASDERLTAYFGAWLADCSSDAGARLCRLAVDMDGGGATPNLSLNRRPGGQTLVELSLPGREIESIDQILWGIDSFLFGRLPGSELRIGDQLTLQRMTERRFVDEELLPLMRQGTELRVEIGGAANGGAASYRATLMGLSRALGFADEFLGS